MGGSSLLSGAQQTGQLENGRQKRKERKLAKSLRVCVYVRLCLVQVCWVVGRRRRRLLLIKLRANPESYFVPASERCRRHQGSLCNLVYSIWLFVVVVVVVVLLEITVCGAAADKIKRGNNFLLLLILREPLGFTLEQLLFVLYFRWRD